MGGGLGIRFSEEPTPQMLPQVGSRGVLFAVRNELRFTANGMPLRLSEVRSAAVIYRSTDSGTSFSIHGHLSDATSEVDLIFPSTRADVGNASASLVLAVARYQTHHFASARYDTGIITNATAVSYKSTAVFRSTTGGKDWSAPGLVTGQGQQSGSFTETRDGSLLLVFGHKDAGEGQKFIVSYDNGLSWSNYVYDLHRGGLYASSVATLDGDAIITAYSCTGDSQSLCPERAGKLTTLRWAPPAFSDVSRGGFFFPVEPDGVRWFAEFDNARLRIDDAHSRVDLRPRVLTL
eukprot:SAG31_NODE_9723_length_1237_cov_1.077329_2_plen_292_part_00